MVLPASVSTQQVRQRESQEPIRLRRVHMTTTPFAERRPALAVAATRHRTALDDLGDAAQSFIATLRTWRRRLVEQRSAVHDFWDDDEVRQVYYPEAERFIADVLGASRVFIFDHVQRRRVDGVDRRQAGMPRQPATRVHVDHTARSGPQRVRDLLGEDAEELLRGRVQVVNLWRPTLPEPLRDSPLAVCDARGVAFDDLVPSDLVYRDRVGETYSVKYNPAHQWYYVPEMRRDEALLLKCCDTKTDRARFMPHTGFTDPTTPPDAMPRESIELRSLVFHPA